MFIDYKKASYYQFVCAVDKNCGLEDFFEKQNQTLDFICTQIANGERPHELLMLQELLEEGTVDPERTRIRLQAYDAVLRDVDYRSALGILDKTFLNTQADKGKYSLVSFFEDSEDFRNQQTRCCTEYLKRMRTISFYIRNIPDGMSAGSSIGKKMTVQRYTAMASSMGPARSL